MDESPPSYSEATAPPESRTSARSNQIVFLVLLAAVIVGGFVVTGIHRERRADRIFTDPFTTTRLISKENKARKVDFHGHSITNRPVFEVANLRIVLSGTSNRYHSHSGNFRYGDESINRREQSVGFGTIATIRSEGLTATIDVGGIRVTFSGTEATIGNETFDLTEGSHIIVLDSPGIVGETRTILPSKP